jgi:ATP-dependent DNA ligase
LLRYVAKVRAGFTPAQRVAVFERFQALEIETCLFNNLPEARRGQWGEGLKASEMKKCRWLKPRLLATIDYLGTDGGESLATSDVRGSIRKFQRFKNPGRAPANPFDGRRQPCEASVTLTEDSKCGNRAKERSGAPS